jgi:thiamine kinase-like enzyme
VYGRRGNGVGRRGMVVLERRAARRLGATGVDRFVAAELGLQAILPDDHEPVLPAMADGPHERCIPIGRGRTLHITIQPSAPGVLVPSHRGIDSSQFLLSVDDQPPSLIAKVLHPDQLRFVDVEASFDAQNKAAALGCAPYALAYDVQRAVSVSEFLDGWATARVSDLKNPELLQRVIAAKRKIQGGPRFKSSWSVFDRIRMLQRACAACSIEMPQDLSALMDFAFRIERMIAAAGFDQVPAHADGLASNIMIGPGGRIQLVDFDEARNVDPYYDLAILANEIFEEEKEFLLALEMFEGRPRQESFRRIRLYAIADDLAWCLWALLMEALSPRKELEFYRYAFWRLMRCRTALQATDF